LFHSFLKSAANSDEESSHARRDGCSGRSPACKTINPIYYRVMRTQAGIEDPGRSSDRIRRRSFGAHGADYRSAALASAALLAVLVGCQAPPQPTGPTEVVARLPDYERFLDASICFLRRNDFPPSFVDREQGVIITQPATSAQWFEPWRIDAAGSYNLLESSLHTTRRQVTLTIDPLDPRPAPPPVASGMPPIVSTNSPATSSARGAIPMIPVASPSSATSAPPTPSPSAAAAGVSVGAATRPGDAPRYRITVKVDQARYSAPDRQATTAAGALALYSERLPTTEGLIPRGYTVQWIPQGRDAAFEQVVLEKLLEESPEARRTSDAPRSDVGQPAGSPSPAGLTPTPAAPLRPAAPPQAPAPSPPAGELKLIESR
jgi:hypothetical protein